MGRALAGLLLLLAASACAGASSPAVLEQRPQPGRGPARTIAAASLHAKPAAPLVLQEVTVAPASRPLAALSRAEIHRLLRASPQRLGSASLGPPNNGSLLNGVELPASPFWSVVRLERSWATSETAASVTRAIEIVQRRFPGTHTLYIGDISRERGGYLRPHRSHQSGRDADIGYYYLDGPAWYRRATAENLDRARTWALLEALIEGGDVEYIFIDRDLQALLREHAASIGEDAGWLDAVFGNPRTAIVRHASGHRTHLHVRFHNDSAEHTGRLVERTLKQYGRI
jgi:murein endopeptidase